MLIAFDAALLNASPALAAACVASFEAACCAAFATVPPIWFKYCVPDSARGAPVGIAGDTVIAGGGTYDAVGDSCRVRLGAALLGRLRHHKK